MGQVLTGPETPKFTLNFLSDIDVANLRPILETWIKKGLTLTEDGTQGELLMDEVNTVIKQMQDSVLNKNGYIYLVARDEQGVAIGVMGLRKPEPKMEKYVGEDVRTLELINAYISLDHRGKGVGYALLNSIFAQAKMLGYQEVIWNSGPRYADTAWKFYTKAVGEPDYPENHYYGEGRHAPIWRKDLT